MFRAGARPKAPGAAVGPRGPKIGQKPKARFTDYRLESVIKVMIFIWVFGKFPAKLGPETLAIGSGSKNGAEITHNSPRIPILRPFSGPDPQLKI